MRWVKWKTLQDESCRCVSHPILPVKLSSCLISPENKRHRFTTCSTLRWFVMLSTHPYHSCSTHRYWTRSDRKWFNFWCPVLRRNYVCLLVVGDLVDEDKLILFLKWGSFFVRRPLANRWVSVLETFGPLSGDKYWKRNPSEVCAQTKNRHSRSGRGATRWSDGCGWLVTCIHVRYNADDVPSRLPSRTPAIQSTILFAQVSELVCFSKWCDTITDLA